MVRVRWHSGCVTPAHSGPLTKAIDKWMSNSGFTQIADFNKVSCEKVWIGCNNSVLYIAISGQHLWPCLVSNCCSCGCWDFFYSQSKFHTLFNWPAGLKCKHDATSKTTTETEKCMHAWIFWFTSHCAEVMMLRSDVPTCWETQSTR